MFHKMRFSGLITVVFLPYLMLKFEALEHIVGDRTGWELLINYTNWSQGRKFHVGDILVFNYNNDQHNVMEVNSTAYTDCERDGYIYLYTNGNDSVTISQPGEHWFICGVGDHCEIGQKLSINVAP